MTLEKVLAYVRAQGWNAEVIVVNDGSRDNTADLVRGFAAQNPLLRLVENPGNRGKGYAVRNGMLNARGEIVVFSDADLSSPMRRCRSCWQRSLRSGHCDWIAVVASGIANAAAIVAPAIVWKDINR